jgi:hypothetical protein
MNDIPKIEIIAGVKEMIDQTTTMGDVAAMLLQSLLVHPLG